MNARLNVSAVATIALIAAACFVSVSRTPALGERAADDYKTTADHHLNVTHNLEKARAALEAWSLHDPRAAYPRIMLAGAVYPIYARFDLAIENARAATDIDPSNVDAIYILAGSTMMSGQYADAKRIYAAAVARKLTHPYFFGDLYMIGFLEGNREAMAAQVAAVAGDPEGELNLADLEAATAFYDGHFAESREFAKRAVAVAEKIAEHGKESDAASTYIANAALREALVGNVAEARAFLADAMKRPLSGSAQIHGALAAAFIEDDATAARLAVELAARYPEGTVEQQKYLPAIRARLAINRGDPARAIELLRAAVPLDLGSSGEDSYFGSMLPVYIRAQADLAAHQPREAVAQFQVILDHPSVAFNSPITPLSHIGLARAYSALHDTARARHEYEAFLAQWSHADANAPLAATARAELSASRNTR